MKKVKKKLQEELCRRFGAMPELPVAETKLGISENVKSGSLTINGLRHPPTESTCGWYIWAGEEISEDPEFFLPLHVSHIEDWCPEVLQYLALPPGWRFQIAPGYEDVWYDESLLTVDN